MCCVRKPIAISVAILGIVAVPTFSKSLPRLKQSKPSIHV